MPTANVGKGDRIEIAIPPQDSVLVWGEDEIVPYHGSKQSNLNVNQNLCRKSEIMIGGMGAHLLSTVRVATRASQ